MCFLHCAVVREAVRSSLTSRTWSPTCRPFLCAEESGLTLTTVTMLPRPSSDIFLYDTSNPWLTGSSLTSYSRSSTTSTMSLLCESPLAPCQGSFSAGAASGRVIIVPLSLSRVPLFLRSLSACFLFFLAIFMAFLSSASAHATSIVRRWDWISLMALSSSCACCSSATCDWHSTVRSADWNRTMAVIFCAKSVTAACKRRRRTGTPSNVSTAARKVRAVLHAGLSHAHAHTHTHTHTHPLPPPHTRARVQTWPAKQANRVGPRVPSAMQSRARQTSETNNQDPPGWLGPRCGWPL